MSVARQQPEVVRALLQQAQPIYRGNVEAMIAKARGEPSSSGDAQHETAVVRSGGRTVLVVEHEGKRGSLRMKARDGDVGEVRFGDGTRSALPLADLKLVCWATEETK